MNQDQKTNLIVFYIGVIGFNLFFVLPFMNLAQQGPNYAWIAINLIVLAFGTVLCLRDKHSL